MLVGVKVFFIVRFFTAFKVTQFAYKIMAFFGIFLGSRFHGFRIYLDYIKKCLNPFHIIYKKVEKVMVTKKSI
jgi:hypothetical protein